jgi:hypothetical protein
LTFQRLSDVIDCYGQRHPPLAADESRSGLIASFFRAAENASSLHDVADI